MADRTVTVTIRANVAGAVASLAQLGNQARTVGQKIGSDVGAGLDKISKNRQSYQQVGSALTKLGAVGALGLGAIAKAAIDYESAWKGVTKTVSGSAAELATLEGQLRGMAKTLPASHEQILAVAEAAGQLGVATPDIAKFTKVMIELGDTTNLTSDEAASSLAQFMNIMGTAGKDVDRLGATIVGLGNNGASTERDIVQMGQRIAGAARQVGLSEAETLAYANALASVGVNAEAGGTAISQAFIQIDQISRNGGKKLEILAATAGMTGAQFQKAFKDDAANAMDQFVQGLGKVQKSGGDTTAILKSLGITGRYETDALRRLAGAGDLLAKSLAEGRKDWAENTALATEAGKRYETTASKIKIAWNNIKDAAITAGGALLPVIQQIAARVSEMAQAFGGLSPEAQKVAVAAAVVITAAGLIGGGLLRAATSIAAFRTAMIGIGQDSPRTAAALGKMGKSIGVVAAAITAGIIAANALQDAVVKIPSGTTQAAAALDQLGTSSGKAKSLLDEFFHVDPSGLSNSMTSLSDAVQAVITLRNPVDQFGSSLAKLVGVKDDAALAADQFQRLDQALMQMDPQVAATNAKALTTELYKQGLGVEEITALLPQYTAQLQAQAVALHVNNLNSRDLVAWMTGNIPPAIQKAAAAAAAGGKDMSALGVKVKVAAKSYAELATEATKSANTLLALSGSAIGVEQAIDDLSARIKANRVELIKHFDTSKRSKAEATRMADAYIKSGKSLDINTQAGRGNQIQINTLVTSLLTQRDAMIKNGASQAQVEKATRKGINAYRAAQFALGKNKKEVDALTKSLFGVPKTVTTRTTAPGATNAKAETDRLHAAYNALPGSKRTSVSSPGARPAKSEVDAFIRTVHGVPASKLTAIRTIAQLSGVYAAKAALASVRDRHVTVFTSYQGGKAVAGRGGVQAGFAEGGEVQGPYIGPRADNVVIGATPREWMMPVASRDYYGAAAMSAIQHRQIPREILGFADGGEIPSRRVLPGYTSESARYTAPQAVGVDTSGIAGAVYAGLRGAVFTLDGRLIDVKVSRGISAVIARAGVGF